MRHKRSFEEAPGCSMCSLQVRSFLSEPVSPFVNVFRGTPPKSGSQGRESGCRGSTRAEVPGAMSSAEISSGNNNANGRQHPAWLTSAEGPDESRHAHWLLKPGFICWGSKMSGGVVALRSSNARTWRGQEKQAVSQATHNRPSFVLTRR